MKTTQVLEAFKEIPTHLKSGKPNANHPSFDTHMAKYNADRKAERPVKEKTKIDESSKEILVKLKKELAQHEKTFNHYASVGGPPRSHPVHAAMRQVRDDIKKVKSNMHVFESEEVDGVDCEVSKEQKAIYDAQTKSFAKDRKENAKQKVSPIMKESKSFKEYMAEAKSMKHDDTEEDKALIKKMVKSDALKEDDDPCWDSHKQIGMKMKNGKKVPNCVPKESAKPANESVFDWKKGKSEIDWKSDDKNPESKDGSTVYKARDKARNAETGGDAAKKNVGRPQGEYGSYKIDKATRDDPKYKQELSKKVMAAKADGFKDREQWKHSMHDAIMKKQLELSGLNPDDHKDAIAKKNPIKLKN